MPDALPSLPGARQQRPKIKFDSPGMHKRRGRQSHPPRSGSHCLETVTDRGVTKPMTQKLGPWCRKQVRWIIANSIPRLDVPVPRGDQGQGSYDMGRVGGGKHAPKMRHSSEPMEAPGEGTTDHEHGPYSMI
jgi:hypothetical protein